jgi:hypothetical protein
LPTLQDADVARPRSTPPSTPFGVWLDTWFKDNDRVTYEAFADDVKVTKSAVSLWISAVKPIQIKPATLRLVARRTGAQLGDLERMVYGRTAETERAGAPGVYLTADELEALLQRAAETAVRRVLDDRSPEGRDG